ncbi:MAG: NAD-dependent epimerase/dehydratase family protein [Magnetococcales bacterium]|nr:NAD-dependent epimerase/dehydratase family protein [Magnetococcales bacterium]MBF0323358.1 NAD-dependent epimerase/dehydratase family protein [Magnetococcales bacterium]
MLTLVTGGAGFIGSHLCQLLLDEGHTVRLVDDFSTGRMENVRAYADNPRLSVHRVSILRREDLDSCLAGVEWVFHLAGVADIVPSIEQPERYFAVNVQGTLNLLESARAAGVQRLVYAASSSSYGIPDCYPTPETAPMRAQYPYALTKHMGEELVLHWARTYRLPAVALRLFNVYGPRSRTTGAYGAVFGVFLAQILNNKPLTVVGDGTQSRDFTFVTDVARAFLAAAASQVTGEAMNVGSGAHQSVNRLVELLGGRDVVYLPKRPGEPDITFADTRKIEDLLGWKARVSFADGVARMLGHLEDWRTAPVWEPDSIAKATETWFCYLGQGKGERA